MAASRLVGVLGSSIQRSPQFILTRLASSFTHPDSHQTSTQKSNATAPTLGQSSRSPSHSTCCRELDIDLRRVSSVLGTEIQRMQIIRHQQDCDHDFSGWIPDTWLQSMRLGSPKWHKSPSSWSKCVYLLAPLYKAAKYLLNGVYYYPQFWTPELKGNNWISLLGNM